MASPKNVLGMYVLCVYMPVILYKIKKANAKKKKKKRMPSIFKGGKSAAASSFALSLSVCSPSLSVIT